MSGWLFRSMYFSVTVMLVIAKRRKGPTDKDGVMLLKHGAYRCLGALISPVDIITCCTCVSDIEFETECPSTDVPARYHLKAIDPQKITILTTELVKAKGSQVTIHPQCDVDGTYDYGIVKIGKEQDTDDTSAEGQSNVNDDNTIGQVETDSQSPQTMAKRGLRDGICFLHTTFDASPEAIIRIPTVFTDWHFCWNGSETRKSFTSKYCIRSCDGKRAIGEAKSGSPVYCDGRLVGILARRYAIGGRTYCAVNGLDGALDFIKDNIQVDVQSDSTQERPLDVRKIRKKTERYKKRNSKTKRNIFGITS